MTAERIYNRRWTSAQASIGRRVDGLDRSRLRLPSAWLGPTWEDTRYRYEQLSFVILGWMLGHWREYDLIYYCDPDIGDALYALKRKFSYKYRLVYGNCSPTAPGYRETRVDHTSNLVLLFSTKHLRQMYPAQK